MKAAVTGGAGFIGHHLVGGLVKRGHHVSVLDDFSTGGRSRLTNLREVVVHEGSVLDREALDWAVADCDVIFHEAAIASVARSLVEPRLINDVNENGTIEVMLAAARNGVGRVVFAGSSAVYGVPDELPCRESQGPDPKSPYGVSNLAAEHYVHALGRIHGIQTVVLRYFNVFGPGQDPGSEYAAVVPRFITAVLADQRPVVNGIGDISRDFVHVEDVVAANLLACRPSTPPSLTCNVASGTATSLLELLGTVCVAAGRNADPIFGPPRQGDIHHSVADISLACHTLGYEPKVSLSEGLARTVDWYRGRGTGHEVRGSGPWGSA